MTSSISELGIINFIGEIQHSDNISAIDISNDFLVIGADEGNQVQVLKRRGEDYAVVSNITLNENAKEIDIEGIACDGNTVYIVGSHSAKRPKIDDDDATYEKNRQKIEKVSPEPDRDRLFRFSLDAEGNAQNLEETSLRSIIDSKKVLKDFSLLPSKENGVDIEGIAIHNGQLYIGFRGPVLRENWVPVLKCRFAKPVTEAELVYVQLDGLGFRDITRVEDGFLILAGPVGDGPGLYQVYFWDGEDCIPGDRLVGKTGQVERLGVIPTAENAKAEGLTLLKESSSDYEVAIVFDGLKNGSPTLFGISK
jgi:Protein of unknown function (DUF3616)